MLADLDAGSFIQSKPSNARCLPSCFAIPIIQAIDAGPFIKLGPLRNSPELAERVGVVSAAGLVVILTLW